MSEPKFLAVGVAHIGDMFGIAGILNPAYLLDNESVLLDSRTVVIKPANFTLELRRRLDPNTEKPWIIINRWTAIGRPSKVIESWEFDNRVTEQEARSGWRMFEGVWKNTGRMFPSVALPDQRSLPVTFSASLDTNTGCVTARERASANPVRPAGKPSLESSQAVNRMHGARLKVLSKSWPAVTTELKTKSGNAVAAYEYERSKQRTPEDPIDAMLATHALKWSGKPYAEIQKELESHGHVISVEALKKRIANLSYEPPRKPGPKAGT